MKHQKNKNVITKFVFIIVGITSIFLLAINFVPVFVIDAGIERRFIEDKFSDSEVYVNKSNPDKNYVEYYELYIGNFSEIFIHFDLQKILKRTEELYFFLHYFDFGYDVESAVDDIEINIILVESNWSASTITWHNKPKHNEIIATVNITDIIQSPFIVRYNFERAINMTEILKENELEEISICLNITENNEKLNASALVDGFGLIWTYEKVILSYTPIISTFVLLSLLIGLLYFFRKNLFICQDCDSKRTLEDKFCRSCGTTFNENILIRGRDYQLILILLWLFISLEVPFLYGILTITSLGVFGMILGIFIIIWVVFCWKQVRKKIKEYKKLNSSLKQTQMRKNA